MTGCFLSKIFDEMQSVAFTDVVGNMQLCLCRLRWILSNVPQVQLQLYLNISLTIFLRIGRRLVLFNALFRSI